MITEKKLPIGLNVVLWYTDEKDLPNAFTTDFF